MSKPENTIELNGAGAVIGTATRPVRSGLSSLLSALGWGMRIALAFGAVSVGVSPARSAEMHYRSDGGVNVVSISGQIGDGDGAKFEQLAAPIGGPTLVILNSRGGSVIEGLIIGETIRSKGFDTGVPAGTICASSCGLIWLAGSTRYVGATAHIGFHAAYVQDGDQLRETGQGNALVGAYLTRLGLSYRAILFLTSSAPDEIAWMHDDDARRIGVQAVVVPVQATEDPTVRHAPTPIPRTLPAARFAQGSSETATTDPAREAAMATVGYAEGRQARIGYEQWFAALPLGSFRDGVLFWAASRSVKIPPSCDRPWETAEWQNGCAAGHRMLETTDIRRKTDKDFWWGWNSF